MCSDVYAALPTSLATWETRTLAQGPMLQLELHMRCQAPYNHYLPRAGAWCMCSGQEIQA